MVDGNVYFLRDFTAPKVYTGREFVCLLTSQVVSRHTEVTKDTGIHITDWTGDICLITRFKRYFIA